MKTIFSICDDAIDLAARTKTFAGFYSHVPPPNNSIHMHNCCEILLCLDGSGTVFIDEKTYSLTPGNIYVANPFEAHMFSPDDPYKFERYILEIDPAFLYNSSSEKTDLGRCFSIRSSEISHKIALSQEQKDKIHSLFKSLEAENDFGDDILKSLAAVAIITHVNDYFEKQNRNFTYRSSLENKTVDTAVDFINKNFSSPLSLEIVAKKSFVSVKELCRLFKKQLGTTVSKYIMSKRISEAKKMLKSGLSVQQTAECCGFTDYTSFIRAFKRTVGMSPGKYKRDV